MAYKLFINGNTLPASDLNTAFGTGGWTAYTPTETGITGTHTTTAYYMQIGKTVWFSIRVVMGAAMTISAPTFTFPVSPHANTAYRNVLGSAYAFDNSAANSWPGIAVVSSASTIQILTVTSATTTTNATPSATVPFGAAWATSDVMTLSGCYEAA